MAGQGSQIHVPLQVGDLGLAVAGKQALGSSRQVMAGVTDPHPSAGGCPGACCSRQDRAERSKAGRCVQAQGCAPPRIVTWTWPLMRGPSAI